MKLCLKETDEMLWPELTVVADIISLLLIPVFRPFDDFLKTFKTYD